MPTWIADAADANAEFTLARKIVEKEAEPCLWPVILDEELGKLTPHQREAVQRVIRGPVGILGGYAGTGKSFSTVAIIKSLLRHHDASEIGICAPTGKAAVRVMEIFSNYGLELQASTIHSMLGVTFEEGGGFYYNEDNPLPYRYVFVDEWSIANTTLAAALFSACGPGTHILVIGDPGQLPPVGHGAPLRDMLRLGIPSGVLEEIHRNSGAIVEACREIRQGNMFQLPSTFNPNASPPQNLKHINCGKGNAIDKIKAVLTRLGELGFDPQWDAQCITGLRDKGPLCKDAVNKELQPFLNPHGQSIPQSPFRVDDKVMQTKNTMMAACDRQGQPGEVKKVHAISNGDIGKVLRVNAKWTVVEFMYPSRTVLVPRAGKPDEPGCRLELANAITGHKMQGSSAKFPLIILDESWGASGPQGVCGRQWLYTALSRAEKADFLLGKLSTASRMIKNETIENRKTMLAEMVSKFRRERDVPTHVAIP